MEEHFKIALFPLNVVLFPGSRLPLFIFEERYKKMINNCIEKNEIFGINLYDHRQIHLTGCTAFVSDVTGKKDTGELNIVVLGIRRYIVIEYDLGEFGFYEGRINYLANENSDYDQAKMVECVKMYNELSNAVYYENPKTINLNETKWKDGKRSLSFKMAEKAGLNLIERQEILEMDTEAERLEYMCSYLRRILPQIREADRINKIIKSDGYL